MNGTMPSHEQNLTYCELEQNKLYSIQYLFSNKIQPRNFLNSTAQTFVEDVLKKISATAISGIMRM